jgi:hypothetical protein
MARMEFVLDSHREEGGMRIRRFEVKHDMAKKPMEVYDHH